MFDIMHPHPNNFCFLCLLLRKTSLAVVPAMDNLDDPESRCPWKSGISMAVKTTPRLYGRVYGSWIDLLLNVLSTRPGLFLSPLGRGDRLY